MRSSVLLLTIALTVLCLGCGRESPHEEEPPAPPKRVSDFLVIAKHTEPALRIEAAHGLGKVGAEAVPMLTEMLHDKQWGVRKAAAEALGRIGPEAKSAVPELTALLQDKNGDVAEGVAEALERINNRK
jgi:HEAT repeat protein